MTTRCCCAPLPGAEHEAPHSAINDILTSACVTFKKTNNHNGKHNDMTHAYVQESASRATGSLLIWMLHVSNQAPNTPSQQASILAPYQARVTMLLLMYLSCAHECAHARFFVF